MKSDVSEIYPIQKDDRRLAPDVPTRSKSRRCNGARYECNIPVTIRSHIDDSFIQCKATDVSRSGILLKLHEGAHAPRIGEKFTVEFYISPGVMPEGFDSHIKIPATVSRVCEGGKAPGIGLEFAHSLDRHLAARRWRRLALVALCFLVMAVLCIGYLRQESIFYFRFDIPIFLYSLITSAYLVTRFLFACFHRDVPVDPYYTPGVSILIPSFNEEEWISSTIQCALNQNYPPDKLEVILIDDGSTDNTVERARKVLERVKTEKEIGDFSIFVQPTNLGKRHALAQGALQAKHDLLVFVDSDSLLTPTAIRQVVQPFKDPKMGAVAGRTEVQNKWTNYLTKMQAVRYYVAFRFFKAAESVFDAVTCLSGPLACYRKSLVLKNLDAWREQTFLGYPATFGDDRSMTNFILREARTGYQDSAVCHTIAPSKIKPFLKQQMRWKRSWLRESLRAAGFMWRKEPFMALSFYIGLILPILSPFIVIRAFIVLPFFYGTYPYVYLLGILGMSMLMSAAYLFLKRSKLWPYGFFFCAFYIGVLMWQMPIAVFTFWKSQWGTRETTFDTAKQQEQHSELGTKGL